jgi:CxxC-x17-CxxC domain-containing protein
MISILPTECPFPVYDYMYFISDLFDPFSFGEKYEAGVSPLDTLFNFRKRFPMPSFLNRDPLSINSDYSNGGRNNKNCYYAMACYRAEDIWYSSMVNRSRNIMDSNDIEDSDFLYEGLSSDHIYKSSFIYFSSNCTDSFLLFDCKNCDSCFGCVNLRNKKYCVWNEQLSKEGYESFIKSINPVRRDSLSKDKEKFWNLVAKLPMNAPRNVGSSNVWGARIMRSRNAFDVVDSDNSEHIRHADGAMSHKDSMDFLYSGGHSSKLYGTINIGSQSSDVRFSVSSKFCVNCEFVFNSKNLTNCFMCFGLQNKSYCVLNVQYPPEEYFEIVDEIKSEMIRRKEYEDPLGFEFSAQAYNFSMAQIGYPLSAEEIKKLGGYVGKEPETNAGNIAIIKANELPQSISEVTDDILNKAILCEVTRRPFKIVASELEFYRRMKLPIPTIHPSNRMETRFRMIPASKKYNAVCAKCGEEINSMFDPKSNFILYCESCYQQEVY